MRRPVCPTESQEQVMLFQWARFESARYPELKLMYHIPNERSSRNEAMRLKNEGVKAGVPDIFLPCARGGYHGLYIELKRREGGRLSQYQREMIRDLRAQDYAAVVCRGFDEARQIILDYLRM